MRSKKQLAVYLSRLQNFENPSFRLEQYPTDSEIAAEVIWYAEQLGDIQGKKIADLGCGTGVLGIGALIFEPEKVFFVDIDERALKKLKNNLQLMELDNYEIFNSNIKDFNKKVDIVIQNPPFGTKNEHADKLFLEKAFAISDVIYSFHKLTSEKFIEAISKDHNFKITHFFKFNFPLKKTMKFHKKSIQRIDVGCWRLEKI
jgi:putative methylase